MLKLKCPKSVYFIIIFLIAYVSKIGITSCQYLVNLCPIFISYSRNTRLVKKELICNSLLVG